MRDYPTDDWAYGFPGKVCVRHNSVILPGFICVMVLFNRGAYALRAGISHSFWIPDNVANSVDDTDVLG